MAEILLRIASFIVGIGLLCVTLKKLKQLFDTKYEQDGSSVNNKIKDGER